MKADVNNILDISEKLIKSSKKEDIDVKPRDVVDNGEEINKEVTEKEENEAKDNKYNEELTEEERKALESGDYDYDPDYSDDKEEVNKDEDNKEDEDKDKEDSKEEDDKEVKDKDDKSDKLDDKDSIEKSDCDNKDCKEEDTTIEKALKNLIEVSNNILERLEKLESRSDLEKSSKMEPIGKAVVDKSQILHKNFNESIGIKVSQGYESLSKSQRARVLSEALINGNTSITAMDVLRAEQLGVIRDEHKELFINKEEK